MTRTATKTSRFVGIANPDSWEYAELDTTGTPEGRAHNEALFTAGPVYGLEVTVPELAKRCARNLDPQHLGGDATTAAIESALEAPLPADDSVLATVKPDLDSVGAMAVLTMRAHGIRFTQAELGNITIIALSDKFTKGAWPGPRPLPTAKQLSDDHVASVEDNSYLAALAAGVADYRVPLRRRVVWVIDWIRHGKEPEGYRAKWVAERRALARGIQTGAVKLTVFGNHQLALVESTMRAPHSLGYHQAPVVIGYNPEHQVQGGPVHRKYTICQWPDTSRLDLDRVFTELNNREPGWGGSPSIGGSPQGKGSLLPVHEIIRVVRKHLRTP